MSSLSSRSLTAAERLAYSPQESAQTLGVSRQHIYKLIADGTLKTFTLGRRRLIARSELERLVRGEAA